MIESEDILIVSIMGVFVLFGLFVLISPSYYTNCLDNIANDICVSKGYDYGKSIGSIELENSGYTYGDANIMCYESRRDYDYKNNRYRFLESEFRSCKV